MFAVIHAVLPVFALILAGYVCRRSGKLGPAASSELNRFVVWLGLPALLFDVTAASSWQQVWQPGFLLAFGAGSAAVFVITLLARLRQQRRLVDASIDSLSASYANTGFIGIPLCVLALGQDSLEPALLATLVVVCVLFGVAVVCIEVGLQTEKKLHHAVLKVVKALASNPLIVSPILGACWAATGQPLPSAVHTFMKLLGGAASPCALVALGLFLAQKQEGTRQGSMALVLAKLIIQPLVTWFLAFRVLHLPPLWANSALLLSALPTGTGPFMLAEFYRREAAVVSSVILVSTLGSLVTLSICLMYIS
ncbi:AEC family transporter [Amantichitinum ursilacus]|uniref:Putative transporter YfdV n=1 Tax=Amantichitinum ursilacus TaxID=857265 RepID=A0A0N0XHM8_9NEIS|nr:AEC family transporter [Amantichitinum ursilacus]KPC52024.1 putative transporter YfdV [Amantichitinum ursilacus]